MRYKDTGKNLSTDTALKEKLEGRLACLGTIGTRIIPG